MKLVLLKNNLKYFKFITILKNLMRKNKMRIFNKNNIIILESENIRKITLTLKGEKNEIYMKEGIKLREVNLNINGNNNKIIIDENTFIQNSGITIIGNNNNLHIGKNNEFYGILTWQFEDKGLIKIGDNCLFSSEIEIRNTDSHPIYDIKTNRRLNPNKDIIIKNNVWLGKGVKVLKGVLIEEGNVVGMDSVITKSILEKNSIIVQNNRIIKKDIYWKKDY